MKCPECGGEHIRKNGHRQHKQNYICVGCGRQFLTEYEPKGYSDDVKRLCLKMDVNGMGVRSIGRVTDIAHTTILNWIEQSGALLPERYDPKQHPQVGELDELETCVGKKQNKLWIWTVVDHFAPGILGWVVGVAKLFPLGVIIVLQLFDPCGTRSRFGSVTSGSVMVILSIQALFQQEIRSSARLT